MIIIGCGAAGLMAAGIASQNGEDVILFDKNEKTGKKLYITGKGRCNVTNDTTGDEFFSNIVSNPKFLMSAINAFSSADTINFLQNNGLNLIIERGNRVFPSSQKASDVIKTLTNFATSNGAKIKLNTGVKSVKYEDNKFIVNTSDGAYNTDKVLIATGGMSYPSTGSTGDGYTFAEGFGHTVVKPVPALVSIRVSEPYVKELQGLSLKNVEAKATENGKILASEFGEMLFTDCGLSGPIILSLSSRICRKDFKNIKIVIDLKPALSEEVLDNRLLRDFSEVSNKQFKNSLNELLPKSLIPVIIKLSNISPDTKINQITREQRKNLVNLLKNLQFSVSGLGGFNEAIITSGGVSTKEINPKTMESKLQKGLFFAGEVIDIDALTGGFNIQLALSTGYLAGVSISNNNL